MGKIDKKRGYAIILLIAILIAGFLLMRTFDSVDFAKINYFFFIPLIFFFLLTTIFNGLLIKSLVEPFNIRLRFLEWYGLSAVTTFYNTITFFRGGAVARAIYLKKNYDFSYAQFLSTLAGLYVVGFFVACIGGIISLGLLYFNSQLTSLILSAVFVAGFAILGAIILFHPSIREPKNRIIAYAVRISNGWSLIRRNRKVIFISTFVSIINLVIVACMSFLEFKAFGVSLPLSGYLLLASINALSLLISITPGSLGIKEAILVFTSTVLGVDPGIALAVAILDRLISLIVLFILGPIYSYILIKKPKLKDETL